MASVFHWFFRFMADWFAFRHQPLSDAGRLLPELFAHLNPMPIEETVEMGNDLAEDLRCAGFTVSSGF